MDKHRTHIFIALVLILLIIAAICAWVTGSNINEGSPEQSEAPENSNELISEDEPSDEPSEKPSDTPKPDETKAPSETKKPQESAKPTSAPVSTPTPDPGTHTRTVNQSGSFEGSTGTNLSTRADWTVTSKNDSELSLTVNLYAYSYTLGIGPRSGSITINGTEHHFTSSSIDVKSENRLIQTKLYTLNLTVPCELGESISISAASDWNFNGVYNKKDISTVSGSTVINIQG